MLDAYVILAPLLLLPVVGLLRFLGCVTFPDVTFVEDIKVDPPTASLKPGESKQFTALVNGSPSSDPGIKWSPNAPNGLYTAPVAFVAGSPPEIVTASLYELTGSATVTVVGIVVTVTPATASLKPGESVIFTALADGVPIADAVWSANAPGGVFQAPAPYVLGAPPVAVTASKSGATGKATVTLTGNAAQFVTDDSLTLGTWKGTYGNAGWALAAAPAELINLPAMTNLNIVPRVVFTFVDPTADARGLQKPPTFATRFAAAWFDTNSIELDFEFPDSKIHRVAVYFIDWNAQARAQKIDILDSTQAPPLLDSRILAGFNGGRYLVWNLAGKVTMRITKTGGPNAVVSGIFFD